MAAYVFRVVPLGGSWVIRSVEGRVLHGYPTRELAWRVAQGAAEAMRSEGRPAVVMMDTAEPANAAGAAPAVGAA